MSPVQVWEEPPRDNYRFQNVPDFIFWNVFVLRTSVVLVQVWEGSYGIIVVIMKQVAKLAIVDGRGDNYEETFIQDYLLG